MGKKVAAPGEHRINPDRLYRPDDLAPLSGLSARQLVRMMDEGRIGFVIVGAERGRRIRGQQWLDWLAASAVEPVA